MSEILAALISIFLLSPIESELSRRLEEARAPREQIASLVQCTRQATPVIAGRVVEDPIWAAWQVYDIWIGGKRPESVLVEIAPACAGPVNILKPYLDGALRA